MDAATNGLRDGAARLGVVLDESQESKLARYLELLLTWNRKINLTAVTEPAAIVDRHFLDSLAVVPRIPAGARSVLDAGAGAGFPGIVIAIARPELRVTCVESIQKKAAFLETLRRELAPGVEVLAARLEAIAADRTFDVAVSRATWEPAEWLVRGAPFVAPGGRLIAMTTDEVAALAAPASFVLAGADAYTVGGVTRRLHVFQRA
jgi:16S rRNA (guanine527-N7)-methyltransferase